MGLLLSIRNRFQSHLNEAANVSFLSPEKGDARSELIELRYAEYRMKSLTIDDHGVVSTEVR